MAHQLFTIDGKRKYLTPEEVDRFVDQAAQHERGAVRTLCLVLAHTGCRISEALALTVERVDLAAGTLTFQTLKQHGKVRYRSIPVPEATMDALELVHAIRKSRRSPRRRTDLLWPWGRTQAFKHVKAIMAAAGIADGPHASPKGLRHGFGVRVIQKTRNPRLAMKWLGHQSLDTTAIYMDVIGDEERAEARLMWG